MTRNLNLVPKFEKKWSQNSNFMPTSIEINSVLLLNLIYLFLLKIDALKIGNRIYDTEISTI